MLSPTEYRIVLKIVCHLFNGRDVNEFRETSITKDVLLAHDRGTCESHRALTSTKDINRRITTIFQKNCFRQYVEQMFVCPYVSKFYLE